MKSNPVSPKRLVLNACYVFLVMLLAYLASQLIGLVIGWIFVPEPLAGSDGNLGYNYYIAYPIRGIAMLAVFIPALYGFSRIHGYRVAFSHREIATKKDFLIETVPALIVYTAFVYWLAHDILLSWYLAGPLAAVFGVFDPTDIFSLPFGGTVIEGSVTITEIGLFCYLWLQMILDVLLAVAAVFVLNKGRRAGEFSAQKAREEQLAQMRRDSGLDR